MKLDDFIKKYDGRGIDFDGSYGNQCVDLYRQYCKEVLNFPQSPGVVGAADIWDTYLKDRFSRVGNTPDGVPNKGDIIIWSKNTGNGYGHVGIFIEGTVGSFKSFDQNWPSGSLCHIQGHYYTNVLGWLKPKGSSMNMYKGYDLDNPESMKPMVDLAKEVIDGKYKKVGEFVALQNKIKENDTVWKERVANEKKQYDELVKELASSDYLNCTQQVPAILEQVTRLIQAEDKIAKELEPKIKTLEERITDIARVLGVEEKKIEEAIRKLMAGQMVASNDHSRLCQWLASRGL